MIISLAVCAFPLRAIFTLSALPVVVVGPLQGIFQELGLTGQEVCFHIACVVSGVVPERSGFGRMVILPCSVNFPNSLTDLGSLVGRCLRCSYRAKCDQSRKQRAEFLHGDYGVKDKFYRRTVSGDTAKIWIIDEVCKCLFCRCRNMIFLENLVKMRSFRISFVSKFKMLAHRLFRPDFSPG